MPRASTKSGEPLQTFVTLVNKLEVEDSVSASGWRRLIAKCGCKKTPGFDFRPQEIVNVRRKELIQAVKAVFLGMMKTVESGGGQLPIHIPVEEVLEIRSPSPAPPHEDSPAFRNYQPYRIDIFRPTIEGDLITCFKKALLKKDASRIRMCGECKRFFWAQRLTGKFCSDACRARHWQKENPTEWAEILQRRKARSAGVESTTNKYGRSH